MALPALRLPEPLLVVSDPVFAVEPLETRSDSNNSKQEDRDNNSGEKYYKAQGLVLSFPYGQYQGNNQNNDHQRVKKIDI